jgi:glycine/D-amino acid oxidase-like deaminating enzyme
MNFIETEKTDILIIGGGIFGSAIAYYCKKENPDKKVVLLEKNEVRSGNTSLALGKDNPFDFSLLIRTDLDNSIH